MSFDPGSWYQENEHPRGPGGHWVSKAGSDVSGTLDATRHTTAPFDEKEFEPQWKKISDPKIRGSSQWATLMWAGSQYSDINETLRTKGDDWTISSEQRLIRGLDRAFEVAPKLQEDTTVYRGLTPDFLNKLEVGSSWTDPGFASTSLRRSIAQGFAEHGVLLQVTVPKGTRIVAPMVSLDKLEPSAKALLKKDGITQDDLEVVVDGSEPELLLKRGTTFTVTSIKDNIVNVKVG